jgi:hypothetical protein
VPSRSCFVGASNTAACSRRTLSPRAQYQSVVSDSQASTPAVVVLDLSGPALKRGDDFKVVQHARSNLARVEVAKVPVSVLQVFNTGRNHNRLFCIPASVAASPEDAPPRALVMWRHVLS